MSQISVPVLPNTAPAAVAAKAGTASETTGAAESSDAGGFTAALARRLAIHDGKQPQSEPVDPSIIIDVASAPPPQAAASGGDAATLLSLIAAQLAPAADTPPDPEEGAAIRVASTLDGTAAVATATPSRTKPESLKTVAAEAAGEIPLSTSAVAIAPGKDGASPATASAAADRAPQAAAVLAPAPAAAAAVLAARSPEPAEAAAEPIVLARDAATPGADSSTFAQALHAQRSAPTDAPAALRIEAPAMTPRWGEELAQKVVWLAGRNESRAELVLTPPQMGKVEVSLSVSQSGETAAHFVSPNPQVREALEQSIARLREVFAAAGIALGQASVSADTPARDQRDPGRGGTRQRAETLPEATLAAGASPLFAARRGLVDTFV